MDDRLNDDDEADRRLWPYVFARSVVSCSPKDSAAKPDRSDVGMESSDCAEGIPDAARPKASISAEDGVRPPRCGVAGLGRFAFASSSDGRTGESLR